MKKISSRVENLRNLEPNERLEKIAVAAGINAKDCEHLMGANMLDIDIANGMIENVIGKFELPLGVATNFIVNDKEYLIPMAVEEPSVVAAASYMAKIARNNSGFEASATRPIMRAQIQILGVKDPHAMRLKLLASANKIITLANSKDKILTQLGGGCEDIEVHIFEDTPIGPMVVLHLLVNVCDAMGANTVNTMAETTAPLIEEITGGKVRLRILSNLADKRLVRARVRINTQTLSTPTLDGAMVAQGIVEACCFAIIDPYRAATHNKGIMNGIDPVVLATGNDWRAIEAGAHAWAARNGRYTSLSRWEIDAEGYLVGSIEMPMAMGIVGGATKTHPAAKAALKLMNIQSAQELAQVTLAVGLAQNMAALRALATEGIQKGHMALHARNIAIVAGAKGTYVETVAKTIVQESAVNVDRAKQVLNQLLNNDEKQ